MKTLKAKATADNVLPYTSIWHLLFNEPFCSGSCIPPCKILRRARREGPLCTLPPTVSSQVPSSPGEGTFQKKPTYLKRGEEALEKVCKRHFSASEPLMRPLNRTNATERTQGREGWGSVGGEPAKAVPSLGQTLSCQCVVLGSRLFCQKA